jgi:hypothetical protein
MKTQMWLKGMNMGTIRLTPISATFRKAEVDMMFWVFSKF